ncbi:MAG: permease prefix domain 1-containing protein [Chloroflexota bacterium]
MGFDQYLSRLGESLSFPHYAEEISEELRGHLEDAAHDLQLAGMHREAGEREAIRRLGSPEVIAAAFQSERHRTGRSLLHRPRLLLAGVAVTTALLGSVAVAGAHTQHPPAPVTSMSHQQMGR